MALHVVFTISVVEFAGRVMAPPVALPTSLIANADALACWLYLATLTLNLSNMILSSWITCSTAQTLDRSQVQTKTLWSQ